MTELVPPEEIERIVGRSRHSKYHYGRSIEEDKVFYILHSQECLNSGIDLRECMFSLALYRGIPKHVVENTVDRPRGLSVKAGFLNLGWGPNKEGGNND